LGAGTHDVRVTQETAEVVASRRSAPYSPSGKQKFDPALPTDEAIFGPVVFPSRCIGAPLSDNGFFTSQAVYNQAFVPPVLIDRQFTAPTFRFAGSW
jgi:hypothetical protein